MGAGVDAKCGLSELFVFIAALVAGTGCSLTSKIMLDMTAVGMSGEVEKFQVDVAGLFRLEFQLILVLLIAGPSVSDLWNVHWNDRSANYAFHCSQI